MTDTADTADTDTTITPEKWWDGWCLAAGSDGRDGRWWPTTPADTEEALWAAYSRGEGHWSC